VGEFFPIVIHHNPDCGTSRNTLAMIRAAGYAPVVIEYLLIGWTAAQPLDLLDRRPERFTKEGMR
jgi:arsenate reductase